jgi:SAM-dependent methyltransferase
MDLRDLVRDYYGTGGLTEAVLSALSSAGVDVDHLGADDLFPVDQLHAGGAAATQHVLDRLGIRSGLRLLDVGSGIGGPARMAATGGATVTGIDLTPEFVDSATHLSARVGLAENVRFLATPGESLPFEEASFDAAVMVHVGMNIPAKEAVFSEIHRVLAPGGRFALYEQMSTGTGDPPYPLPWAPDARTSFLETINDYRRHLENAGFAVDEVEDRTEVLLSPRPAAALTPADVFGSGFAEAAGNWMDATRAGLLRSVLILASA